MIFIGIGSNLGDRERNIEHALECLNREPALRVQSVSSLYETEPVGGPEGQPAYLNAAALITGSLEPRALLTCLKAIEAKLGRDFSTVRWGPRRIDLDILLMDDRIVQEDDLIVPHPRIPERLFVLEPMCELAPDILHPVERRTIRELLEGAQRKVSCKS